MNKKNFYIYYPLIFLIFLFFIDKIFSISFFKERFLQTGNAVYYKHRELLLEKLKKDTTNKNLILVFGDSRGYSYSDLAFEKNFVRKNSWKVYNFSAAQAVPAYSFYMFRKVIESKVKPKLVVFAVSPEGFDDSKRLIFKPFLRLGADREFISKYWKFLPKEDRYEYFLDKIFVYRSLEFDYKLLLNRIQSKSLSQYDPKTNSEMMILNLYNGAQVAYTTFQNDDTKLKKDSLRMKNIYFSNFKIDSTQYFFIEEMLKLAKENEVMVNILFPKVYPDYKKIYDEFDLKNTWWKKLEELSENYQMKSFNLNEVSNCSLFYDASHQSSICFNEQLNFLLDEYEKTHSKK
ncbi:MAG: DUF1574 domain-containing protein [Leptospiraceae bacterium]|nr:DUF1574 family protein [Leptospiraceae bacterium]MCK6380248.1 DUF1574 domain-containing protein [Leptospiraceae bacterium]NUM40909.1 DUF1574 family protein [Leptospiraceae bacterium]